MKQNRVDARFRDHEKKRVLAVEMSCPGTENREKKKEKKTIKYVSSPLGTQAAVPRI